MTASGPARDAKAEKLTFAVPHDGEDVPAVLWRPERPARHRPLVLLGHGGGMHKESPFIARLGNWLASGLGMPRSPSTCPITVTERPPGR